jgi:hypothetical protein
MNADATEDEMRCCYLYQQCIPLNLSTGKGPIGVTKIEKEIQTARQVFRRRKHCKFVLFLEALSTENKNRKERVGSAPAYFI